MATYNGIKKIKIGDNIFNLAVDWSNVTNQPTIPVNTDEKVKSTPATAATTYYLIASTSSSENTATTSKHASLAAYTTADSGTSGYTQLRLGNTTATSSAGGKEGQIRLYGTTATYYVDLKAGAPSANRTITFPNKGGTVALTDDIPDVSGFITSDSDEKVAVAALTSGTTYYPILATGTGTATRQIDSTLGGLKYVSTAGTTSAVGTARLQLGNGTASGTANNEQGVIRLYGTTAYYTDIKAESGLPTANRTIYVPSYAGTMYLTCTSTTNAVGGATTAPVYVDDTGRIQVVTSIPYSLLSDTPTIPSAYTLPVATYNTLGGVKPWKSYTASSTGPTAATASTAVAVNTITNTSGKYYAVEMDKDGRLFVNVPWTNVNSSYLTSAVTSITTSAGAHSTQSSATGAVSFNVPTKTSHLTNDSGFITTYTDEKVKSTALANNSYGTFYLTFDSNSSTSTNTLSKSTGLSFERVTGDGTYLTIKDPNGDTSGIKIQEFDGTSYSTSIVAASLTANRTITLPDESGTVVVTGSGNTISSSVLPASGVTAGTYDGGVSKTTGWYIPTFTVDAAGRITSATDLGTLIPFMSESSFDNTYYGGLVTTDGWALALRSYSSFGLNLWAGETSTTITISNDSYSTYTYRTHFRVADVQCYDTTTGEPVLVEWSTPTMMANGSSITLTVSIAEAYEHNIRVFPILTYAYYTM